MNGGLGLLPLTVPEVRRLLALPEIIPAARRTVVAEERRDGYTLKTLIFDT